MNKERNVIEPNAIVVFDRDVNASKLNELFKGFQGDIIIIGDLMLDEANLSIDCDNLYVMGGIELDLRANSYADICVRGNLYVGEHIDCANINVNGSIFCMRYIDSFNINISEDVYVDGYIETNGYDINVGGEFICKDEVSAAEITVLGKIIVKDGIQADSISAG